MMNGDKMLILHILDGNDVAIIRFFGLQRRQCNATAADQALHKLWITFPQMGQM